VVPDGKKLSVFMYDQLHSCVKVHCYTNKVDLLTHRLRIRKTIIFKDFFH